MKRQQFPPALTHVEYLRNWANAWGGMGNQPKRQPRPGRRSAPVPAASAPSSGSRNNSFSAISLLMLEHSSNHGPGAVLRALLPLCDRILMMLVCKYDYFSLSQVQKLGLSVSLRISPRLMQLLHCRLGFRFRHSDSRTCPLNPSPLLFKCGSQNRDMAVKNISITPELGRNAK